MPALEKMDRHQDALLWAAAGNDDYGRQKVTADYEELKVRWVRQMSNVPSPKGGSDVASVTVIIDREVAVGGRMWRGAASDLPGTAGVPESDVYQVLSCSVTKDIKGHNTRYELKLGIYRDDVAPKES